MGPPLAATETAAEPVTRTEKTVRLASAVMLRAAEVGTTRAEAGIAMLARPQERPGAEAAATATTRTRAEPMPLLGAKAAGRLALPMRLGAAVARRSVRPMRGSPTHSTRLGAAAAAPRRLGVEVAVTGELPKAPLAKDGAAETAMQIGHGCSSTAAAAVPQPAISTAAAAVSQLAGQPAAAEVAAAEAAAAAAWRRGAGRRLDQCEGVVAGGAARRAEVGDPRRAAFGVPGFQASIVVQTRFAARRMPRGSRQASLRPRRRTSKPSPRRCEVSAPLALWA